ncbi:MAG: branched-chain amino acid ABC transporter permease [Halodesulfurarchaeum sp.]
MTLRERISPVSERITSVVELDRPGSRHDLVLILGVMLGLFVVYTAFGMMLGYGVNGIARALRRITFLTAVYSLVVLALNLHWGYAGLFNIGVIGYMAVGAYVMGIVTNPAHATGAGSIPGLGLPLPVGILLGMLAAAFVGLLTALPALRLRADYLAIVTVGVSEIIRFTLKSVTFQTFTIFGQTLGTGGGSGLGLYTDPEAVIEGWFQAFDGMLGGAIVETARTVGIGENVIEGWVYALFLVFVIALFYWLLRRIGNSPFGRVLRAIKEDEDATNALGKNTPLFKIKAFMLGTALMGLAGMLWYGSQGFLNPNAFRPETTFFIWIALIIGGAGSNTGSIIGGALFAGVLFEGPRYVRNLLNHAFNLGDSPANFIDALAQLLVLDVTPFFAYVLDQMNPLRLVITGVVLVWLMHNRPQGLLG